MHGAGGRVADQPMAAQLRRALGTGVSMARLPAEDMSVDAWRGAMRRHRATMGADVAVIAHSFGASIALLDLAEEATAPPPRALVLLAMPFWGPDGWDVEDYALPSSARLPAEVPILLAHCRDDDVVPVGHLARHAALLPSAAVRTHESGGHQFAGRMDAVARDLLELLP